LARRSRPLLNHKAGNHRALHFKRLWAIFEKELCKKDRRYR